MYAIAGGKMASNDLIKKIKQLKRDRNAVILVHNYQRPEVQDIADYIGDSLGLSQEAAKTDAEVIVFCGVHFMAETASILCPDKKVIMPDVTAGCPMAEMITDEELREMKAAHPDATVVAYVNTTAAVKAETHICCTSANAVAIVESIVEPEEIIFVPDKYLGAYVTSQTGREMILWNGFCPTHVRIIPEDVIKQKEAHPKAKVLVHPECIPEVTALADAVLSTSGICRYAKESEAEEFIIGTEVGILYRLQKENPGKKFYPASEAAVCPNMKKTTLEKVLWSLEDLAEEVKVPEEIRIKAIRPIEHMLDIV